MTDKDRIASGAAEAASRLIGRALDSFIADAEAMAAGRLTAAEGALAHIVTGAMQCLLTGAGGNEVIDALGTGLLMAEDIVLGMAAGPVPPGIGADTRGRVHEAANRIRAARQGRERKDVAAEQWDLLQRILKGAPADRK